MAAFVPHWSNKYFHVMASIGIVSNSPYIMTASQIASVRVFKTALPTLSVRDHAIIVLNHIIGSEDMLVTLHRRATRSHRPSMAMPPAAVPYRASGLVLWHKTDTAIASLDVRFRGVSGHRTCARLSPLRTQAV